jgi:hypothetical protein
MSQSPADKNVNTEVEGILGICHQATTGEDTKDWEDLINDSAVVTCNYDL